MIKKILLCFLSMFLVLPVFAGSFETAIQNHEKVVLYITSPQCGYCKKFDPIYIKLVSNYGQKCKFVKVDATTSYGRSLASSFKIAYVPFVAFVDSKQKLIAPIRPDCLLDYKCVSKDLDNFVK